MAMIKLGFTHPKGYWLIFGNWIAGDPVSLFHHLGLGFWSLLANPAAGLVESAQGKGPRRIAEGFIEGLHGLIANTVYAFSNATVKASNSARKVCFQASA